MSKIDEISAVPVLDSFQHGGLLSVCRSKDQPLWTGPHMHPHGELFFLHSGHLRAKSNTGHWLIPPQQICWIPPHTMHGTDDHRIEWTRIHLDTALCAPLPLLPCVWSATDLTRALFEKLAERIKFTAEVSESEQRLLNVVFDELMDAPGNAIALPLPATLEWRILAESWRRNPTEMNGLDGLAKSTGVSRRTLSRTFRAETGMSLAKWQQVARLMAGVEMLSQGQSVTDTAMSLGYDSVSSFVALCRRLTGMSPKILASAVPIRERKTSGNT